jgi:hypothetical protein
VTRFWAVGAIAAQVIFIAGWVIGAAVQRGPYSSTEHYISDLASLTADHAWILLVAQGIAGVLTIAFALFALRQREPVAAWLVAASGLGLDNLSDAFFRLDCRAIDGCIQSSWHAHIHGTVGTLTSLATLLAPFALARRYPVAIGFGVVIAVGDLANYLLDSDHGFWQRFVRVVAGVGLVLLALQVAKPTRRTSALPIST